MIKHLFLIIHLFLFQMIIAQETNKVVLVGYVYESNNRGYLNEVKISVVAENKAYTFESKTDRQGKFEIKIPITEGIYNIEAEKSGFKKASTQISTKGRQKDEGVFAKLEMSRLPGYVLEMSLVDLIGAEYGVEGARIEVYNNTLQKEILNIPAHSSHIIQCLLEQGNEYVFLIRKEGYYAKRLRANVNVNGCILCMEGFGTVTPSVVENLTKENTMGTLSTVVPLKKMVLNETMKMDNIYYDLGKATLRPEAHAPLDELAKMMFDNPQIVVELSSHTDCRGSHKANLDLSQQRANSVVNYIKTRVKLDNSRIEAKGYGETRPINSCVDGIDCTEELHQQNRRTELTIVDILAEDPKNIRSLASMMQERNFDLILEANNQTYTETGAKVELYHKTIPSQPEAMGLYYTGYKIQLMDKKGELSTSHFIFYEFDKVYLDILKEQHYAFLIGDFKEPAQAQEALKQYQKQFPQAKVVKYKDGIRNN